MESAPRKPKLWLRYVDDTFVIWQHGHTELLRFLEHINSLHENIQFTMEIEKNDTLPFLDTKIIKKPDGHLGYTVYRKQTHTNRYLNAASHHHPAQLASVGKSLFYRANILSDPDHRNLESKIVQEALHQNGFNRNLIRKLKNAPQRTIPPEDNTATRIILPYIKGTSDRIGRLLRNYDIKTSFNTLTKIKNLIRSPKDTIPLEGQGVYEIPCGNCDRSYIGQTNRRVSARRNEHILAVKKSEPSSALAQHVKTTGHTIGFENTKIIKKLDNFR